MMIRRFIERSLGNPTDPIKESQQYEFKTSFFQRRSNQIAANWILNMDIKSIPPKNLVDGITGYYAHGHQMTLGLVEIKKGSRLPEHQHIHEQITYIIEGELDMTIDGSLCELKPGMYYVIPSNTPHSA